MQYQIGFIIEQALGHITHSKNLQKNISRDPTVQAFWGLPAWGTESLAGKVPLYRSNWTVRAGLRTRRALSDMQRLSTLDALFFHTQVTAILSPDWLRRVPSVVSLDATPLQYDALGLHYGHSQGPDWLEHWKWRLNELCFRLARHIVTWSEWTRQGLIAEYGVSADKVTVIPPGVDTQGWMRPNNPGRNEQKLKILFVGSDMERKGGLLLLDAFRHLRRERNTFNGSNNFPDLELHLVTQSSLPEEPGLTVHTGLQPNTLELKRLFFDSDIFCLPTQGDCLPMVLSEAGAAGLPSISTRLAAIPEIVHDGKTGFLVPPGDLDALILALQRLILDPYLRQRQGQAAKSLVRQKFDAGCNAIRLLELLKDISAYPRVGRLAN
jgi:glycosyltransferase involved in cell wall biosynthesis